MTSIMLGCYFALPYKLFEETIVKWTWFGQLIELAVQQGSCCHAAACEKLKQCIGEFITLLMSDFTRLAEFIVPCITKSSCNHSTCSFWGPELLQEGYCLNGLNAQKQRGQKYARGRCSCSARRLRAVRIAHTSWDQILKWCLVYCSLRGKHGKLTQLWNSHDYLLRNDLEMVEFPYPCHLTAEQCQEAKLPRDDMQVGR